MSSTLAKRIHGAIVQWQDTCFASMRYRFDSGWLHILRADSSVAERRTENPEVGGSMPPLGISTSFGGDG